MDNLMDNTHSSVANALNKLNDLTGVNAQETDLVILKEKVLVAPLTGTEEQVLKTANSTINTFVKNFNELLYNKCTFPKRSKIKSYEDFLKYLTPQDKSLLIFAMALSSFDNLGTIEHQCEHCGEKFPLDIKPDQLWHEDSAPHPWDLNKDPFNYIDSQVVLDGKLQFDLKLPTEEDRLKLMDFLDNKIDQNMETNSGLFSIIDTLAFLTKKIIIGANIDDPEVISNQNEIIEFLQNLPLKVKDAVINQINLEVFDKYMPALYQNSLCTRCHKPNKVPINIEITFFRKSLLLLPAV